MSFDILNQPEISENGQKLVNFWYVSPKDFKGCLLVHWLFSNFSIANFVIAYEFFKGIHILYWKTKRGCQIHKKAEDMSY